MDEPVVIWSLDELVRHKAAREGPKAEEPVIVWNSRDPLGGRTRERFEAEIRRLLSGRVEAAYVFGSYGTKEFGSDSDIDMMIVADTDKPFVERALDYPELLDLVPDMDLFVYTPEEFGKLSAEPTAGFWVSALDSLKRIL
jgi:predicted nucleotidyltransferase